MKLFVWLGAFCLSAGLAFGDVVMEQKLESQMMNGAIVFKGKGDKARIESPNPMGGNVVSIIDTTTGKITILMSAQKMAMEQDIATMIKQSEAMQKAAGVDPSKIKPVPTGKKQKIGEWDAEEYTLTVGPMTIHMWNAASFPNGKALKDQLKSFSKISSGGSFDPNNIDLPGMVVRTEMDIPGAGKMTTTLVSVKETPVPASDFVIPQDYQKMAMPQMPAPAK